MYSVKISEAARNDIYNSSVWYNEQLDGLGKDFIKEVFAALTHIEKTPLHYPVRFSEKFRFAKTNRFPFLIVYEIVDQVIIINSVFHTSRNPSKF